MAKTKVVREIVKWRRSETKGYETGRDSARSPKIVFFRPFWMILFHFLMQKDRQ